MQKDLTPFSTTPAVYASFSDNARALLEGLIVVSNDPELESLMPELQQSQPDSQPIPLFFHKRKKRGMRSA